LDSVPNLFAGVYGTAKAQPGVIGFSTSGDGAWGLSFTGTAIRAVSFFGPGIDSFSGARTGVSGVVNAPGPGVGMNLPTIAGVVGTAAQRPGVIGTSNALMGIYGFSTSNAGVVGQTANPSSFAGFFAGNVHMTGTLTSDSVKGAVVPFPDGTKRLLVCMESPEPWFEDFGAGKLKRGRAVVRVDRDFAKVIKRGDYHVFLTPRGDCRGLYVRRQGGASFEVREHAGGKSSVAFSYRIVGRRKDIRAHRRFAKIDTRLQLPAAATRPPRKGAPTAAELRKFVARVEKEARERAPTAAELRRFLARVEKEARERAPKGVKRGRRPRVRPGSVRLPVAVSPRLRGERE
jgi:hypothetical protein